MLKRSQRFSRIALTLGALACGVGVAEAGPPLICHAFDAGKAPRSRGLRVTAGTLRMVGTTSNG